MVLESGYANGVRRSVRKLLSDEPRRLNRRANSSSCPLREAVVGVVEQHDLRIPWSQSFHRSQEDLTLVSPCCSDTASRKKAELYRVQLTVFPSNVNLIINHATLGRDLTLPHEAIDVRSHRDRFVQAMTCLKRVAHERIGIVKVLSVCDEPDLRRTASQVMDCWNVFPSDDWCCKKAGRIGSLEPRGGKRKR